MYAETWKHLFYISLAIINALVIIFAGTWFNIMPKIKEAIRIKNNDKDTKELSNKLEDIQNRLKTIHESISSCEQNKQLDNQQVSKLNEKITEIHAEIKLLNSIMGEMAFRNRRHEDD